MIRLAIGFLALFLLTIPAKASVGVDMVKETLDFSFDTPLSELNERLEKFAMALEGKNLSKEDRAYIHMARSYVYYYQEDYEKENREVEKALEFNPRSYLAYVSLLDSKKRSGDHEGAAVAARKAAEFLSIKEIGLILGDFSQKRLDNMRRNLNEEAETERLLSLAVAPDILWKDFEGNRSAAEARYNGKEIVIDGQIAAMTIGPDQKIAEIRFDADERDSDALVCALIDKDQAKMAALGKGDGVILAGIYRTMGMKGLYLDKCRIVE